MPMPTGRDHDFTQNSNLGTAPVYKLGSTTGNKVAPWEINNVKAAINYLEEYGFITRAPGNAYHNLAVFYDENTNELSVMNTAAGG